MKNTVHLLDQKNPKTLGFNDELFITSSKHHTDFSALENAVAKSGLLETVKTFPLSSISKITMIDGDDSLKIEYSIDGKVKDQSFQFDNINAVHWVGDAIGKQQNMRLEEAPETTTMPLVINIGKIVLSIIATTVFIGMASDSAAGVEEDFTGRRSGIKQLLYFFLGMMGPYVTGLVGAIVTGYFCYSAYTRYKSPSKVMTYVR